MPGRRHNRPPISYRDSGVDIDAGNALVEAIKPLARSTRRGGRRRRSRRLRRAVRPEGRRLHGPDPGRRQRRRRHQAQDRHRHRPARHHRHRPRRHVRQRPAGAGRRAAVLPRLFRLRQARCGDRARGRRRHRRRLPAGRLRADRRRDGRDARHVRRGRLRPRRLCRRRGGAGPDPAARRYRRRRRADRPCLLRRALQRLFAGAPAGGGGEARLGRARRPSIQRRAWPKRCWRRRAST